MRRTERKGGEERERERERRRGRGSGEDRKEARGIGRRVRRERVSRKAEI